MQIISVFPDSSAELAIATLAAVVTVLTSMIIRIVLCTLAASATRKALEDPIDGQADADALRAHRLAVLQAILAALGAHGHVEPSKDDTRLMLSAQNSRP